MESYKMIDIPSEEEFERASQLMEQDSRNLDEVRTTVRQHFDTRYPLHDFYILSQRDVDFRGYIFFQKESDIEKCESAGAVREIKDFVYLELERLDRGKRGEVTVAFEVDSYENVGTNFEGDYLLRLR